ncbi:MAG: TorF family putative porin [Thiohalophilus sp.]|uniref:TorF family putative porin n=1 Tax=Thiohalophilus sp. TaxID=3028392 RepID=UPI0028703788|nr:TorF family putative porin [Thiohalophilus sp.]MDR9437005.1 TorF family putative porin [Thiohalophilus sp.]
MKKANALLVGTILAASTVASNVAVAELSGNVGFTSNYIWRGVTQGSDDSAISGGIDYAHDSGFYAGTWVSSLSGGSQYEQDLYLGYGFDAGPVGMDVGYIRYMYPIDSTVEDDFDELYVNASYEMFTAGVAMTMDTEAGGQYEDDMYMFVGADFEVKDGLSLGLVYGDYDFDDPASTDYSHYQISLSKDDFVFAFDQNDQDGAAGDARFTVSYSKSFDL